MKRVAAAIFGTVAGLVALLQFKTHPAQEAAGGGLPAAGLPSAGAPSATPTPPQSSAPAPTQAPSSPTATTPAPSAGAGSAARTVAGDAIDTRYGTVQVELTLTGSKITNVRFLQLQAFDRHSEQINSYAGPILLQETLQAQSARIDTVSGATYTSDGYAQSVQSALDKAGIR